MKTIHPAVAEHVMEENEKLRGLLREAFDSLCDGLEDGPQEAQWSLRDRALAFRIKDALSQQAEPAPAQDEREAFEAWFDREVWKEGCYGNPDVLRRKLWPAWQAALAARPAKTEQQPEQSGWISVEGCEP